MAFEQGNLIFLISLPRSGSTLLQHILASHSQVAATAEPWVMFPSVLGLRPDRLRADYNSQVGTIALRQFLDQLPSGQASYYAAVREMGLQLYGEAAGAQGKPRFLDKTSRYYMAFPELYRAFPGARFVFLVRHPLAVLSSFLSHMIFGDLRRLSEQGIRDDLLHGYRLLNEAIHLCGNDAVTLQYEQLVHDPTSETRTLCRKLDLEFEPAMCEYGTSSGVLKGRLVDPKSIHAHDRPVSDYLEQWRERLQPSRYRKLSRGYLDNLGRVVIEELGYDFVEMQNFVGAGGVGNMFLANWSDVIRPPALRSAGQRARILVTRLVDHAHSYGIFSAVQAATLRVAQWPRGLALSIWRRVARLLGRGASEASKRNDVSSSYRLVEPGHEFDQQNAPGWAAQSVAENQARAYEPLLKQMHDGDPREDFLAAAMALELTGCKDGSVLEVGCGNGYYSEILQHLTKGEFSYRGIDYSKAMIESAAKRYPDREFSIGDATSLPFEDSEFDVVWSGTVLMHLPDYSAAIREAARVARLWCVFHSTPLVSGGRTIHLVKKAYGTEVPEVLIGEDEFNKLLCDAGLVVRHIVPSLRYLVPFAVGGDLRTVTHVCKKTVEE